MREIITKELLSEVLGEDIFVVKDVYNDPKKYVYYDCVDGREETINIYELEHKCKCWAIKQGYKVVEETEYIKLKFDLESVEITTTAIYKDNQLKTLSTKMFNGYQWILDNKI